MAVSVVHIRHVRVRVSHWLMLMSVGMWFAGRVGRLMGVPVVNIMHVWMRMHESLVNMLMFMSLGQV